MLGGGCWTTRAHQLPAASLLLPSHAVALAGVPGTCLAACLPAHQPCSVPHPPFLLQLLTDPLTVERLGAFHLAMLLIVVCTMPHLAIPLLPLWPLGQQRSCETFLTTHHILVGVVWATALPARFTLSMLKDYEVRVVGGSRSTDSAGPWRSKLATWHQRLAEVCGWAGGGAATPPRLPRARATRRAGWWKAMGGRSTGLTILSVAWAAGLALN